MTLPDDSGDSRFWTGPDRVRNLVDNCQSLSFVVRLDFYKNKISNISSCLN